jgi:hypothetical protein
MDVIMWRVDLDDWSLFTCSGVVVRFLSAGWEVHLLSARAIF